MKQDSYLNVTDEVAPFEPGDLVYLPERFGFTAPGVYLYQRSSDGMITLSLGKYSMTLPKEALAQLRLAEHPDFESTIVNRIREFEQFVDELEREVSEITTSFDEDFFEIWSVDRMEK